MEYLLTLGGKGVLSVIEAMVGEIYALQLQRLINWTGKGGKYEMSKSSSASCIIGKYALCFDKELQKNNLKFTTISECTMFTTNSTRFKTESLFKYHLQHSSDRVRSQTAKSRKVNSEIKLL